MGTVCRKTSQRKDEDYPGTLKCIYYGKEESIIKSKLARFNSPSNLIIPCFSWNILLGGEVIPVPVPSGKEGPLDPSGWGEVIPVPVPSGKVGPLVPSGWGGVIPVPVPSGEDGPLFPSG